MGFTIDMITGNVSDITNGADSDNTEDMASTSSSPNFEPLPLGRLLPVSEASIEQASDAYTIPEFLIDCDVDSFIEDVAQ